jgi:hypothetical protein
VTTPLTVSEAARRIPGARPKDISDLLYRRRLDDARCPIVGGRRLIPLDYLPEVERVLRDAGYLRQEAGTCAK